MPAAISRGANIQIQLPGNSGKSGTSSVGQFEGADGIYEFNFAAVKEGSVTVLATTQKPFPWDPAHGQFVLALDVVPPDAIEGRTGSGIFPMIIDPLRFHGAVTGGDHQTMQGMSVTVQRPAGSQGTIWDGGAGAQSR